jgi:peptidoglycan/xylan/chitin deacetylase (PgdA/CDA1 family)
MKTLPNQQRLEIHQRIRERTKSFVPTPTQHHRYDLMDWEELQSLDERLITIGSHSMTHPILSNISDNEMQKEIVESRRVLEKRLQRPVEYFCYPNGAYDDRTICAVKQTYKAAIAVECNTVTAGQDLFRLPRISAAADPELLAWRLHRPTA